MRKGFTLVELSIVLVIIGLLVGGILVSQSMITAARITRYVKDIEQYDIVLSNFKMAYNTEPGDSKMFNPPGNGNGIVDSTGVTCNDTATGYYAAEDTQVWAHLSQAGMIKGDYQPFTSIWCGGVGSSWWGGETVDGPGINAPAFGDVHGQKVSIGYVGYWGKGWASMLLAMDVIAIDNKMDDGKGDSGRVVTQDNITYGELCNDYMHNHNITDFTCRIFIAPLGENW